MMKIEYSVYNISLKQPWNQRIKQRRKQRWKKWGKQWTKKGGKEWYYGQFAQWGMEHNPCLIVFLKIIEEINVGLNEEINE